MGRSCGVRTSNSGVAEYAWRYRQVVEGPGCPVSNLSERGQVLRPRVTACIHTNNHVGYKIQARKRVQKNAIY